MHAEPWDRSVYGSTQVQSSEPADAAGSHDDHVGVFRRLEAFRGELLCRQGRSDGLVGILGCIQREANCLQLR